MIRNNDEKKCEFLKTLNHINVLLNRVHHKMYIIDNIRIARFIFMWNKIIIILKNNENIDNVLTLCCFRHKEISIEVSKLDDFFILSLENDYNKKSISRLECEHACINKCYSKSLHNVIRCLKCCQRIKKDCDHVYSKFCEDFCDSKCQIQMSNIVLLYGHVRTSLSCHFAQTSKIVQCYILIEIVMLNCKYIVKIRCCKFLFATNHSCNATCEVALKCGHDCKRICKNCNSKDKNDYISKINHEICKAQFNKQYITCNHACLKTCHENKSCRLCLKSCKVWCNHSRCNKKCHEFCVFCVENYFWFYSHCDACKLSCAMLCDLFSCFKRCSLILNYDHECSSICDEICLKS